MRRSEVHIGQWVRFLTTDTKDTFVGFVIKRKEEAAIVAIPSILKTKAIPYVSLHNHERVSFSIEDIDSMIDVALDTKDFKWVEELSEMKNMLVGTG